MEESQRGAKSIIDTTSNRSVYNKARKDYLEQKDCIQCSICCYHRGENDTRKYYGTVRSWYGGKKVRYPNWKLATKNRKQWMNKPFSYKIIEKYDYGNGYVYIDIKF